MPGRIDLEPRSSRLSGPALQLPPFATINQALRHAATTQAGLTFIDAKEHETKLSFAELQVRATRVAGALIEIGVLPKDRVAIILPTGADFMDAFFGALLAGAVPVPLYPPVRLGRMEEYSAATARMIQAAGARIVLSDTRVKLLLGAAIDLARPELGCPTVGELRDNSWLAAREVSRSDLALIQFSSGSTVDPKPVALSHYNLLTQCAALKQTMPGEPGTITSGVSWLPLYHDMGLIGCLLSAVYWPGNLALLGPEVFLARPALWLRAISRHKAIVSPAPNFAYAVCTKRVRDEELEGVDLSGWKYALDGAEPVSCDVMNAFAKRFERWGFRKESLLPVYGLSEASLAVTFTSPRHSQPILEVDSEALARGEVVDGSRKIVGAGKPVAGVQLEVRDDEGNVLSERQVGRVWVKGPSVMEGYFQNQVATQACLQNGWLDTGDLGIVVEGELYLCGRAKDLVIIRGANHVPQEFEECLSGLDGVREGCAVALGFEPDDTHEEALLLLVETTGESKPELAEEIKKQVLCRTGIKPHTVELLCPGTLPRTSSGKLRRREALKRYLCHALTPPAKVNALKVGTEMARSAYHYMHRAFTDPQHK